MAGVVSKGVHDQCLSLRQIINPPDDVPRRLCVRESHVLLTFRMCVEGGRVLLTRGREGQEEAEKPLPGRSRFRTW